MNTIKIAETLELQECQRVLENTLRRLDQVGAGIAAIHVNAAIEQIKTNLKTVAHSPNDEGEPCLTGYVNGENLIH